MVQHAAAQITIGGWISRALVPGLLQVLAKERASLDWGDRPFTPSTAEELLGERRIIDGELVLQLCDPEARDGRFDTLETYLRKRKIPFDRRTEAGFDAAATLTVFRPEDDLRTFRTDGDTCLVAAEPLWDLYDSLSQLRRQLRRGARGNVRDHFESLLAAFQQAVPPRPEPLPALEIGRSLGLRSLAAA